MAEGEIETVSRDNAVCVVCQGAGGWKENKGKKKGKVWQECLACEGTGTTPEEENEDLSNYDLIWALASGTEPDQDVQKEEYNAD